MKKPPDQVRDEFVRQWLSKAEEDLNAAKSLIAYGVDVRYPGDLPRVTTNDAQQALGLAEKVRESILPLP